jgi:hypothetical protein
MFYQDWLPCCAICKQVVDLTESKTDEYGQAVHENCYASRLISSGKMVVSRGFERAIGSFLVGDATLQQSGSSHRSHEGQR